MAQKCEQHQQTGASSFIYQMVALFGGFDILSQVLFAVKSFFRVSVVSQNVVNLRLALRKNMECPCFIFLPISLRQFQLHY